jgi:phage repressor protein C with HTH and peptisase S24 domain
VCENGTVATVNHREILQALAALDLTQEQIGAVIGRDRSAVSRLLTGKRAMKTSEVEILTALIETTRAEREGRPLVSEPQRENEVQAAPPPINAVALPKDVPVHGTALGGDLAIDGITHDMKVEQTVLEISDVIEMVRRPPSFAGNRSLYAVYVAGSSMEPRYEPGDLLYVDPRRPPSIGDDVIVQLRDGNGHDGEDRVICALIKRLVRRSTAGVELEQYNPPLRFTIAVHHVAAVHRVVKMGEVLGV